MTKNISSSNNCNCNCKNNKHNNNKSTCQDSPCTQLTSLVDAIDTIRIPGSGLLSVGNLITNGNSNFNSNLNVIYGSDPLQVFNPLGTIIYGDLDITLTTNSDVMIYNGINYINGSLNITDSEKVFNINDAVPLQFSDIFPCLIGINGSLNISTGYTTKITGFNKLKYITGQLVISNDVSELVYSLTTIPCFSELETIGYFENYNLPLPNLVPSLDQTPNSNSTINIHQTSIYNIIGFEKLKYVSKILIDKNEYLQTICGFQSLLSADYIVINSNQSLNLIKGFESLKIITQDLSIASNGTNQILNINAFQNLIRCSNLLFDENTSTYLCLRSLRNCKDILIAESNLESFDLPSLYSCNNFIITQNNNLRKFNVCNLYVINGYLNIIQNNSLTYLNNFDNLKIVSTNIAIIANNTLEKIIDFKKLKIIGSVLQMPYNYQYESPNYYVYVQTSWFDPTTFANVLPNYPNDDPQNLDIPNSIFIYQNPILSQIDAFNNLQSIPHSIYIMLNYELDYINAFNNARFALDLDIIGNPLLKNIKIFEELTYIRYLILSNTMCATKICGLDRICQADLVYIDVQTPNQLPNLKRPLPTVEGVYNYYSLGTNYNTSFCAPSNCDDNKCYQCKCINPKPLTNGLPII
jgi:hypothetical protein